MKHWNISITVFKRLNSRKPRFLIQLRITQKKQQIFVSGGKTRSEYKHDSNCLSPKRKVSCKHTLVNTNQTYMGLRRVKQLTHSRSDVSIQCGFLTGLVEEKSAQQKNDSENMNPQQSSCLLISEMQIGNSKLQSKKTQLVNS